MNATDDGILKGIVHGVEEMIWALAEESPSRSADLLDVVAERLTIAAQRDRRNSRAPAPKGAGPKAKR
jgi:hypothetical protein